MHLSRWFALAALVVSSTAAADPAPAPSWQATLDDLTHLHDLFPYSFQLAGGTEKLEAQVARRRAELTRQVDALADDSPELTVAVCKLHVELTDGAFDRAAAERRLKRAIAAETKRKRPLAERYASLRNNYLALSPNSNVRGAQLVHDHDDELIGGPAFHACKDADLGHLRIMLANLYDEEKRYARDAAGTPYAGETTRRHDADATVHELDAMYRELVAADPYDPAIATLVDFASTNYCDHHRASVCLPRLRAAAKVMAIRERALAADDPMLGNARVAYARLIGGSAEPSDGIPPRAHDAAEGERLLRQVVAEARPGSSPRVLAALDLQVIAAAHHDSAAMKAAEATLVADLAQPGGDDAWTRSEAGLAAARMAHDDGRTDDAIALLAATARGFAAPDQRAVRLGVLEAQRGYDFKPVDRQQLDAEIARLHRADAQHSKALEAELARLLPTW
jgi:hypothetical protein